MQAVVDPADELFIISGTIKVPRIRYAKASCGCCKEKNKILAVYQQKELRSNMFLLIYTIVSELPEPVFMKKRENIY